jgi:CRISPR-associated protein Cas2
LLTGYGERVQYSVFRCRLTAREAERLRWELTRIVAREDAWLIVPVCADCLVHLRAHEGARWWHAEPASYVVV